MAKAGRKSKYETYILPKLEEIKEMASIYTESDIAKQLGVSLSSFMSWKNKYPELQNAIKDGKQSLIIKLETTLFKRAFGYEYDEKVEVESDKGNSTTIYHKHAPADISALKFLLKNRDKGHWSDDPQKQDIREQELNLKVKALENQMNGFI